MTEIFKNATGEVVKPDSINEGEAIVGSFGDDKAVVKKKDGKITAMSAVCTHQGCIVGFNGDKKTLDCPCHGSRFALDGVVLEGPAVKSLGMFEVEVKGDKIILKD